MEDLEQCLLNFVMHLGLMFMIHKETQAIISIIDLSNDLKKIDVISILCVDPQQKTF